ncbi:MAG: hypothetical protein IIV13_06835 [Bacteroidaceae bacterium]|nr:hypothetical protein [Bacteroidaceae bacterium]
MKKILLSFVLLLACVGGWAQTVVTEVKPGKMYTMECQPNDGHTTRFISDNGTVINGRSAEGTYLVLEEAGENKYYIKSLVSGKYIYFEDNNIAVSLEKPAKAWTFGTGSSGQGAYVTFSNGGTHFLNNNGNVTIGGTENLQLANHSNKPDGKPDGTNYCSQWRLHEYDYFVPISDAEIPSGFYRFKNKSTNMYLAAPERLPTKDDYYQSFTVTLSSEQDDAETHRDVWYVQNLRTNGSNEEHANEVIYRIWCFQGGYGLGTDRQPRVVGSYDNIEKCPRLYSIQKTVDCKYVIAGHFYDNVEAVAANIFGLSHEKGAITNKNFLKPYQNNTTVSREGTDKSDASAQWEISIVSPDELSKSVTIGSIGVGTFAFNSNVQIPEGVEAYVATERGEKIGLTKLEGTIPARMGVVLRKTTDENKSDFQFEAVHGLGIGMSAVNTDGSLTPVEDHGNLLVGTLASTELAVGDYILAKKKVNGEATDEVVFGRISEASNIAANKAYLPKEAGSQTRGFYTLMWGDDVETGIEEIQGTVQRDGIFVEGQQIVIVKNGLKYNVKGQRVK